MIIRTRSGTMFTSGQRSTTRFLFGSWMEESIFVASQLSMQSILATANLNEKCCFMDGFSRCLNTYREGLVIDWKSFEWKKNIYFVHFFFLLSCCDQWARCSFYLALKGNNYSYKELIAQWIIETRFCCTCSDMILSVALFYLSATNQ